MSKNTERLEAEEVYFVESDDDVDDGGSSNNLYSNTNTQSKITSGNIRNNNVAPSINKTEKFYSNRSDELPRQTLSVQRTQTADDILFGDVFALQKRRMMASANKTNNVNNVATSTLEGQETTETAPNTETAVNASSQLLSLEIKET